MAKSKNKIPDSLNTNHIQELEAFLEKKDTEIKVLKKLLSKLNKTPNDNSLSENQSK